MRKAMSLVHRQNLFTAVVVVFVFYYPYISKQR